jgi:hypothetical protein
MGAFSLSSTYGAMASGHAAGTSVANAGLAGVQGKAIGTAPSMVPGFVTDTPREASLNDGSIGGATVAAVRENEAATAISTHSRTRQKFVIDPSTDPMMINANRASANPEKTMEEVVMETPTGASAADEIHTCIEGGDEYVQTCRKTRVIRIKVTPEIKTTRKWCDGHPNPSISAKRRYNRDQLSWCSSSNPCKSETVISQHRKVEIIQDEWIDGCGGLEAQSDAGSCRYVEMTKGGPETRTITGYVEDPEPDKPIIDSEPITRDSWMETYTYSCLKQVEGTCQSLRDKGCTQIRSECAEIIGGVCVAWKQTFKCPSAKRTTTRHRTIGARSPFCLTGNCVASDYEANEELLNAMSHLAILKEAQNDIRANVGIFKGQVRKCSKNCANFRDCCTTGKGWGVSMNLSSCSGEERELAEWRAKKRCVFVGTYCAEKMLGVCTRKKSSFCCFGNKLSKLLNDQGRRQLGIGFGGAEAPDCRGLTPEELSRIDMSRMDLSELYEEVQANFKPKTEDHMARGIELERIKENMAHLTGRTAPPSGCSCPHCRKQRIIAERATL